MVDFYSNAELIGSDSTGPIKLASISMPPVIMSSMRLPGIMREIRYFQCGTSDVDAGGAAPEHALRSENNEVFVGRLLSVSSNYKSPIGPNNYDDNIRAMVLINGLYEGDATKIPRTPPLLGQEDPGQSFIFEKQATRSW